MARVRVPDMPDEPTSDARTHWGVHRMEDKPDIENCAACRNDARRRRLTATDRNDERRTR